jgi:CRP-like cAMP-binding protein
MMHISEVVPSQNHLLASLPALPQQRLFPSLELCFLPLGRVLYEPGCAIDHVYFPVDSIISLLSLTVDGSSAETSIAGNEGVVGAGRLLGAGSSHDSATVHSAGSAFRLPISTVLTEFELHSDFMFLILRYMQTLMVQMAQTAVCNRHHRLEQQLCRWLLLSVDRLPSKDLLVTHKLISNLLGVRREGVTEAVGKLQKLGVIENSRGHIVVRDRERMEAMSCECYGVIKHETQRLYTVASNVVVKASSSFFSGQTLVARC